MKKMIFVSHFFNMMKRTIPNAGLVCLLALVHLQGCSKKETLESKATHLLSKVPSDANGFVFANMQSEGIKKYIASPTYRSFLNSFKNAPTASSLIGDDLRAGMQAYFRTLEALGIMPAEENVRLPFGDVVAFLVPKKEAGFDFGAYYTTSEGVSGKELLANAKKVLSDEKVNFEISAVGGAEVISVRPFANFESSNVVVSAYRDSLGIDTVYIGATEKLLTFATNRQLAEAGFTDNVGAGPSFIASANYKRAIAALGNIQDDLGFGYVDTTSLLSGTVKRVAGLSKLPISSAAFSMEFGASFNAHLVALTEPKNDEQKIVLDALAGNTGNPLSVNFNANTIFGIVLDCSNFGKIWDNLGSGTIEPERKTQFKDILNRVGTLSVELRLPVVASLYPDLIVKAFSTDPNPLASQIKGIVSGIRLPQGMSWQTKVIDGFNVDYIPFPFGVGVYSGANKNALVISSTEAALIKSLKESKSEVQSSELFEDVTHSVKDPLFAFMISYPKLYGVLQSVLGSVAMLAPGKPGLDIKQFEYMKFGGDIGFVVGYEPGILHVGMAQQLPKS